MSKIILPSKTREIIMLMLLSQKCQYSEVDKVENDIDRAETNEN